MRYCDERKYKSSKNESNKTIVLNLGQGWCSVLGSAVWSFDRRHPFSKVTTANSESTGNVGVIVEILSLVKKWHPKWNIENFFGFVPLRLWELWILLLASWGGWIIRARPLELLRIFFCQTFFPSFSQLIIVSRRILSIASGEGSITGWRWKLEGIEWSIFDVYNRSMLMFQGQINNDENHIRIE